MKHHEVAIQGCSAHTINYGGGCLNCGWEPDGIPKRIEPHSPRLYVVLHYNQDTGLWRKASDPMPLAMAYSERARLVNEMYPDESVDASRVRFTIIKASDPS